MGRNVPDGLRQPESAPPRVKGRANARDCCACSRRCPRPCFGPCLAHARGPWLHGCAGQLRFPAGRFHRRRIRGPARCTPGGRVRAGNRARGNGRPRPDHLHAGPRQVPGGKQCRSPQPCTPAVFIRQRSCATPPRPACRRGRRRAGRQDSGLPQPPGPRDSADVDAGRPAPMPAQQRKAGARRRTCPYIYMHGALPARGSRGR